MNINSNELLLLKKVRFGQDAEKQTAAVTTAVPETPVPQTGLNALMFQGLKNVASDPQLASEVKIMNDIVPQQTDDKAANEYVAPFKSNLAFQGKAGKVKTVAMAALMGLATLGATSTLTSCDDKEYAALPPNNEVNVTVNVDLSAITEMMTQMQIMWQKMLEQQQITNEQLQQNNEFMQQLINMYQQGQTDANEFYAQMYAFMMSSTTNQQVIIDMLTQNGMTQEEANKTLQQILQEVKAGNLTAEKAWEQIVKLLGEINIKLDGVFEKINAIYENDVQYREEVNAALNRIEQLVNNGNAKVDVTNNLLNTLVQYYENDALSKDDLQQLLDAVSKNGDKIDSTNNLLDQMKDQDKQLQAEVLEYIAAVGFEMNRNFGDLIEAVKNNTVDLSDVKTLLETLNQKVDQNTESGKENTEAILNYLGAIGFEMVNNMNNILNEIGSNTAKLDELTQLLAKMQNQDAEFQKNVLNMIDNLGTSIIGKLDNIIGKFDQYNLSLDGVEQLLAKIQDQDEKFQKQVIDLLNGIITEAGNNTTELKNISQMLAKMENQDAEFQKNVLNAIDKLGVDISGDLTNIFNAINNGNSDSSKNIEALLEQVLAKLDDMSTNQQKNAKDIIEAIGNIKVGDGGNIDISSLEKMMSELVDLVSKNNKLLESIDGKMDVIQLTIDAAKDEIIELLGNEFNKNDQRYTNIVNILNEIKANGNSGVYDDTELLKKLDSILVILDKIGNKNYDDTELLAKLDTILDAIKDHAITVDVTGKVECNCNCGSNHEGVLGDLEDVLG